MDVDEDDKLMEQELDQDIENLGEFPGWTKL